MKSAKFQENIEKEVVGLIPAGGLATRIAPIPCSKEIFPIGFPDNEEETDTKIKVVSHYLLERMKLAGIKNVFFIVRKEKWDILSYYGDGTEVNMNIGYLLLGVPYGTPFTLNQAYPFITDKIVALGFPDIIFDPRDAFSSILDKLYNSNADIVLGLFKTDQPHKMDMVDVDQDGKIIAIDIKPENTILEYTWTIAVWKPSFSEFMNDYLNDLLNNSVSGTDFMKIKNGRELYVGDVMLAAFNSGLKIDTVTFQNGFSIDVGTPYDLIRAITDLRKLKF